MATIKINGKKVQLDWKYMPHTTPVEFRLVFQIAHAKWPNLDLTYVGTDEQGNTYMQEAGNVTLFLITAEEFQRQLALA